MIRSVLHALQRRWLRQHSLGRVLARMDDHLLDDIGLTRHEAETLLRDWRQSPATNEKRAEAIGLCPAF